MTIARHRFPNTLLVLPNCRYFFAKAQIFDDFFRVVRMFDCAGVARLVITSIGTFGYVFPDSSPLASIDILRFTGQGSVPQEVMDNANLIHGLQEARMQFINFTSAAFFGRICGKANISLADALYNGQDKVAAFHVANDKVAIQWTATLNEDVSRKIRAYNARKSDQYILKDHAIDDAIRYIQHVMQRQNDFEYADLQLCMVMNYQAAILHNKQHAAASFALNFSVIESLAREIFTAYGLVDGNTAKPFATKPHRIARISRRAYDRLKSYEVFETLHNGGLLDRYLYQQLDNARIKRNSLMHKGVSITPEESGDCQTIVRDLWALLVDTPFELTAPWSYRR